GGVRRTLCALLQVAATAAAVPAAPHQDECDTLRGLGGDDHQVGEDAVGDESLLAIEDIVSALVLEVGLDVLQVRAGARFGHADGEDGVTAAHYGPVILRRVY